MGLYTVLMGVTGSALMLRNKLDGFQDPRLASQINGRTHAPLQGAPSPHRKSLDAVLAAIAGENPGFTPLGFGDLQDPAKLPVLYLEGAAASGRFAQERAVSFDPDTGMPLQTRNVYGGFLGACAYLHIYLGAGLRGSTLNGILGTLFLGICLSGWLLWWPGIRGIRRALRVHWRARLPRLNWDLHTAGGFWINPALVLVVLTGVVIIFPVPFQTVLAWMSGTRMQTVQSLLVAPANRESAGPLTSPEQAFQAVRRNEPTGFAVGYLALPAGPTGSFDAYCYRVGSTEYTRPTHIYIDRRQGTFLGTQSATRLPRLLQLETYVYALHFGTFAGLPSQVLWFLIGLTPVGLLFSGAWMFLRRQHWF